MRVLITGSAGVVGTILLKGLRDRHQLRGFDIVPTKGLEDAVVADIGDADAVRQAMTGMDAVIHLVNVGGSWELSLQSTIGVRNVLEAARLGGVTRIAYASRAGLLPRSVYPPAMKRTVDLPPRPENFYSVSKVFAENLGYVYFARYGLEFVAVRIGNLRAARDAPTNPHHLSHGDCVRCFEQAITEPDVGYQIVFGVSDSDRQMYDLDHGRRVIGYFPKDRS